MFSSSRNAVLFMYYDTKFSFFNPFEPEFSRTHVALQENCSCFALLN